jgi:hypothetical protein
MARDYSILYDPNYDEHGTDAELILLTQVEPLPVTVIDKTSGVEVQGQGPGEVGTVEPSAVVRAYELSDIGVDIKDLSGATIEFNGKRWRIESTEPLPAPSGEAGGEIRLILIEVA